MNSSNANVHDALKLEEIKYMEWVSESFIQKNAEIAVVRQKMAARNYGNSGLAFKAEVDIIFKSVDEIIDKAIAYRLELGLKIPALLEPASMKTFNEQLDRHVDAAVSGIHRPLRDASEHSGQAIRSSSGNSTG